MEGYDKVKKGFLDSLKLLDVPIIKFLVLGALILYNTLLIPDYNKEVTKWFSWFWFKLFFLLITIWITCKDKTIGLLMAIAFTLSVLKITNDNKKKIQNYDINIPQLSPKKMKKVEKFDPNSEFIENSNSEFNKKLNSEFNEKLNSEFNEKSILDEEVLKIENKDKLINDLSQFDGMESDAPRGNSGIAGYEKCYNNCNNNISNQSENLNDSCASIQAWPNEMSSQGLNCKTPGWAGEQVGANINNVIN